MPNPFSPLPLQPHPSFSVVFLFTLFFLFWQPLLFFTFFPYPYFLLCPYHPNLNVTLLHLFPLLARNSTLTRTNKLLLYKQIIRAILTYAAPVWSNTSSHNYHRIQISQSKCLRVIGNFPRRTPVSLLHASLNIPPIREFVYQLTVKFF